MASLKMGGYEWKDDLLFNLALRSIADMQRLCKDNESFCAMEE